MRNAKRTIGRGVLLGRTLDNARRSRVMQLTAAQRCMAVGFIKQLYLDRLWSYGLKVRAINSQSSVRVLLVERDASASDNWLRNVYFPCPPYRPYNQ